MPRMKKNIDTTELKAQEIKPSTKAAQRVKDRIKKAPKRELMELIQQDGKNYNKRGVKSLDELLGEQSDKYSTSDIKEYERTLENMNTSDLQRHAASVQILPKEDRRLLIKLLLKQFQINNSSKLNMAQQIPMGNKPISDEVMQILSEGR